MSTPTPNSQDPRNKAKKPSFLEKLSEKQASSGGHSLVDAIVRQAEKEANGSSKNSSKSPNPDDSSDKENARAALSNSKTLLGFVIIVVAAVWVYFFVMLSEGNQIHSKFGKENLTTELNRKSEILHQMRTDYRDTKKFSKLLRTESLANQVRTLDLTDPILNYERPEGVKVTPREGSTDVLLKVVDSNGSVVYFSEAEIRSLEDAHEIRVEFVRSALAEILTEATELQDSIKTKPEIEDELTIMLDELLAIDPEEKKFPSAVMKSHFAAAQSAAKNILKSVKSENLNNLVADIKKQARSIDVSESDEATQQVIESLQTSLNKLSAQRSSSFDTALAEIKGLNLASISDNEIYQKVVRIIGDPRDAVNKSDLATAATLTRNLGRINTINELQAERIAWTDVIDRSEKIVRLGADLERDTEGTPLDTRHDIDPDGQLVTLLSYSGKSRKGEVEIEGDVLGEGTYDKKSFTLLADLIDALESSKYFMDVSGFAFSREEDRQGRISSPLSFKLLLQDPAVTDPRDNTDIMEKETVVPEEENDNVDVKALEEIEFSLPGQDNGNDEAEGEDFAAAGENPLMAGNDEEYVDTFEALDIILDN